MAIEHIRIRTYSRAKGHSALAAAAYRGGYLLLDPRSGAKHDYRGRAGIIQSRCLAPNGSPSWADDPQALWSAAEGAEHRKNSTVCRDFNIALPHELDDVKRWDLTLDVAHRLIERYGFAVQASHHRPTSSDERYFYAHLLATTRRMEAAGLTQKTRVLDGRINGKGEVEWILQMVKQSIREHLAQHAGSVGASNSSAVCEATSTQGESFLTREQTRFEGLLARYREQGRLINTPEGHTAEQARRDHETRVSSPKAALGAHGLDGGVCSLSGDIGAEARLKAPLDLSALPDKH
ncbi:plasmid mobilization protein [Xanthomonas vasicola]|uniref:MobA/MobL family protein n=1 Tax=Xanthomonas vasicola TaxID=56459 RepID=UPI0001CBEED9|nr:MobA/MobL family protein [Xanthomonas vasicola]MBV6748534.1 MobA/MobL family protein [Xanthomonas vasicola pv. vasculorum NCPPB 890]MBV6894165.1 MobA/MobL family protein [Xanthomonas vasicola pv. vasculorum]MDO6950020.1 MobA/MobL family protein [Xanthomonas vasicola]MDO6962071.1 MobA/MobL family protein [Xanthomonas vasicola]MDO6970941.1 MobA/MobL family protein [Xanthomonas vasicola]